MLFWLIFGTCFAGVRVAWPRICRRPRALALAVLALALPACNLPFPPPNPTPTPTPCPGDPPDEGCTCEADGTWKCPPPPEPVTKYDELRLDRFGTTLVDHQGTPFNFRGHASCCQWDPGETLPDWSLASRPHLDRIKALGFNVSHWRSGPWRVLPDFPDAIKAVGGPYLDVGGKADLAQWNPAFWAHLRGLLDYAGSVGVRVELDVVDGWGCKPGGGVSHPGYHPWKAESNVQGEDHATTCGTHEIVPGSVHDRWVRKVFEETVQFSHVYYQDGNEINLVRSYSVAWTASIGNILRDVERKLGTKRHLYASNAPAAATADQVDLVNVHHNEAPTEADRRGSGKPALNNEYNPAPAFTAAQVKSRFCDAKRNQTYFWYWRHSQSREQFEETARLLNLPCEDTPVPERRFPQGVPEHEFVPHAAFPTPAIMDAVNETAGRLAGCPGGACQHGREPQDFLALVAGDLRKQGYWAGQHIDGDTDEIAVARSCTDPWEGYHVTSFSPNPGVILARRPSEPCLGSGESGIPAGKGCPGVGAGAYRGNWTIPAARCPAAPPPPSACPVAERLNITLHNPPQSVYNLTFVAGPRSRCLAMGKEQNLCPLGPEGSEELHRCEAERIGPAGPSGEALTAGMELQAMGEPPHYLWRVRRGTARFCSRVQQPQVCSEVTAP